MPKAAAFRSPSLLLLALAFAGLPLLFASLAAAFLAFFLAFLSGLGVKSVGSSSGRTAKRDGVGGMRDIVLSGKWVD